jgi:hypothetical protein
MPLRSSQKSLHYRKDPADGVASGDGEMFPDNRKCLVYRKYIWHDFLGLANWYKESKLELYGAATEKDNDIEH